MSAINFGISPLGAASVAGSNVLVTKLKMEPNPIAMTVHTKQMTL